MKTHKRISDFISRWVLADEEPKGRTAGSIHIITPGGRVELKANFNNKEDFERIKSFVNNEADILFSEREL